jgi:hypothetical protein
MWLHAVILAGRFYFDIWTGMDDNNDIGFTLLKGGHP